MLQPSLQAVAAMIIGTGTCAQFFAYGYKRPLRPDSRRTDDSGSHSCASAPWRSFSNQTADLINAHTHTHAHAHARPRARAHTRTQPGISSTFSSTVRWASTLFMSCTRPYVTSPGGGMGVRLVCIPLVNTGVLRLRSSCGCGQYRFENGTYTHDANTNTSHHITSHGAQGPTHASAVGWCPRR